LFFFVTIRAEPAGRRSSALHGSLAITAIASCRTSGLSLVKLFPCPSGLRTGRRPVLGIRHFVVAQPQLPPEVIVLMQKVFVSINKVLVVVKQYFHLGNDSMSSHIRTTYFIF
jgi:hypothetical protein